MMGGISVIWHDVNKMGGNMQLAIDYLRKKENINMHAYFSI